MVAYTIDCINPAEWVHPAEHGLGILKDLVCIVLLDLPLRLVFSDQKTRWFALHFITNMVITVLCLSDLLGVAQNPLCSFVEPTNSWHPSYAAFALHFYHLTCFTTLRLEDVVHHVLFGGGLGMFNFFLMWGRMTNLLMFFMTGLPGGIDYLLLVLVKTHRMERLTQKAVCASINTWLRAPGHVFTASLMAICVWQGTTMVPYPGIVVSCVAGLCLLNGVYYGEQAVGTFNRMAALSPTYADKHS